jgi:hypothetical protein
MNIETKFDVGQEVYFIYANGIYKRPVSKINVGVTKHLSDTPSEPVPLITYHFDMTDSQGGLEPEYRYENEVFVSIEDLTKESTIY